MADAVSTSGSGFRSPEGHFADSIGRRVLRPAGNVLARRLGDSAILIHLKTNRIYELNETGARVWELLAEDVPLQDVLARLHEEFEVDRETLLQDVTFLIGSLQTEGLLDDGRDR